MKTIMYCITWGEIRIQSFVVARSSGEAIQKLQCEINIKSVDIIR